jgi:hypothetical protein
MLRLEATEEAGVLRNSRSRDHGSIGAAPGGRQVAVRWRVWWGVVFGAGWDVCEVSAIEGSHGKHPSRLDALTHGATTRTRS